MNRDVTFNNCMNCLNRFDCENINEEKPILCDYYGFDEEAATCNDCSKKDKCRGYIRNKAVCKDYSVEPSCEDCTRQDNCKNFTPGGRVCDKFDEIRYCLTEKGCLFLALYEVSANDGMFVDINGLADSDFFEQLDHEVKLNGLVEERHTGMIGKMVDNIKRKLNKEPKVSLKDIFLKVARDERYDRFFGYSDKIVEMAYTRFAKKLSELYSTEK